MKRKNIGKREED